MTTYTYQQILEQTQQLTVDEQLQLLADLANIIRQHRAMAKPQHSILELEGLGQKIWQDLDVNEYVRQERDSWDG
ncbi:hypothetical protein KSD_28060 [Ktedonobacter sp. SOSP1-85]|uniref:hypothetical protein n=1 Tax=Ktedonobacter sp. SOSP1-85 TaxID=2778367 RepID=UPI0019156FDE|nr:hypothetical protein [Ktedonobacter sp. SOSP1-85]GHO75035.1 hypothetical protein KSD_28060 [Ktedonobacter sp. SOSP1-85]